MKTVDCIAQPRLLAAVARGARIEFPYNKFIPGKWVRGDWEWTENNGFSIKPGDEHLQYGLISTELRAFKEADLQVPNWIADHFSRLAVAAIYEVADAEINSYGSLAPDSRAFLFLLTAEYFADMGM